jgi:hypothetical protein
MSARKELLVRTAPRYRKITWSEKGHILDGFVSASGYRRKRAIVLLNHPPVEANNPIR